MERGKQISLYAVGAEHERRLKRKLIGLETRVIRDDDTALCRARQRIDIIGKALRSPAHNVPVHAVCAGADYAAQAGSAEFKLSVEAVLYLLIVSGDCLKLAAHLIIERLTGQPAVILFHIPHARYLLHLNLDRITVKKAAEKYGRFYSCQRPYIASNISLPTPHIGQAQSSGRSLNAVPGAMPFSGSPFSGS
ncbi:hypothetical protein SDC9_177090 [bioreactor metagenome]|uniref:Uncharacterized protein n=1 Tax=bioreactor metagenome TaxID=1076179 RepID=A0A645GRW0_9ZZZZ